MDSTATPDPDRSAVTRQMHSQATAFEAACTVINLAAADEQTTQAVLPTAPLLIALLGGGRGPAIAEHSAWALGEQWQYNAVGQLQRAAVESGMLQPARPCTQKAAVDLHHMLHACCRNLAQCLSYASVYQT